MAAIDTTSPRQLLEKPSTATASDSIKDMKLSCNTSKCECGEAGDFFHSLGVKLNDAKSVEEFKAQIVALIQHIWLASHDQKMSPCILTAVRECIEAGKQTKLSVGPVVQFYDCRLEGRSLPAWIILHSPLDNLQQVSTRHSLLQLFLDEFVLTEAIRNELYSACATTGFNNFFSRVRQESLRQLQARPKTTREIGRGLWAPPSSTLPESLTVVPDSCGFKAKWFVPDMSQRLESGLAISIEFVAKGQVWGLYIRPQGNQWRIVLCLLKPSQLDLERKDVSVYLGVSRRSKRKLFRRNSTMFHLNAPPFAFNDSISIQTLNYLPVEGDIPNASRWILPSRRVNKYRRFINKDGSCYLTLKVWCLAL